MKIIWLQRALLDLERTHAYISQDNPTAGQKIVFAIERAAAVLRQHPFLGHNGRREGTRELVVGTTPYSIIYRVEKKEVCILVILHGARRWPQEK